MDRARQAFSLLDPTGLRPTAIVIGVILALFFGSQLVNALIPVPRTGAGPGTGPGTGPISGPGQPGQTLPPIGVPTLPPTGPGQPAPGPGGSVLEVGRLRIPLEAGWTPGEGPSSSIVVRLTKGSSAIDLVTLTVQGGVATPVGVYDGYMQLIGADATGFANAAPSNVQIGQGMPAARGAYQGQFGGSQIEGEITAFVAGGTDAWVWDAFGSAGTFGSLMPEAQRMIDNIQVLPE